MKRQYKEKREDSDPKKSYDKRPWTKRSHIVKEAERRYKNVRLHNDYGATIVSLNNY